MRVPDEVRPVCSCGEKMKLIRLEHYYGSRIFWDCYNGKCQMNIGEEYMYTCEPDEVEKEGY